MSTRALWLLLALFPLAGWAQKDDPIPYSDDEVEDRRNEREQRGHKKHESRDLRETEDEDVDGERSLASTDDAVMGLTGQLLTAVNFVEASRGSGADARFQFGLRFDWEWGRLMPGDVDYLRQIFFAGVQWSYLGFRDGTKEVFTDTTLHYFTLTQGFAFPFGTHSPVAFFAELGLGLNFTNSSVVLNQTRVGIGGTKFLFQYGAGLKLNLMPDWHQQIALRLELTRFRRGYMDDTMLGLSMGATF